MRKRPMEPGDVFGEWAVLALGTSGALCACSCRRTVKLVQSCTLRSGHSARCLACSRERKKSWPACVPYRVQQAVQNAIKRCTVAGNEAWAYYGGKGVVVHPPWLADKHAFAEYVMSLPGWDVPGLWLNRIDRDKGYEPGNVRWATPAESCKR